MVYAWTLLGTQTYGVLQCNQSWVLGAALAANQQNSATRYAKTRLTSFNEIYDRLNGFSLYPQDSLATKINRSTRMLPTIYIYMHVSPYQHRSAYTSI